MPLVYNKDYEYQPSKADARAKKADEDKAKKDAEAKAQAEAEKKAKEEADAQAKADEEARAKAEYNAKIKKEMSETNKSIEACQKEVSSIRGNIDFCNKEIGKLEEILKKYDDVYNCVNDAYNDFSIGGYIYNGEPFHKDEYKEIFNIISSDKELIEKSISLIKIDLDKYQTELNSKKNELEMLTGRKNDLNNRLIS